ncbi:MAG: DUF2523 domain-containing protein [Ottowia sp.]|nr:DUF2523 domain-containing protein [Ottowia sp.]
MAFPALPIVAALGTVAGHVLRFSIGWLWKGLALLATGLTGNIVARVLLSLGFALVGVKGMDFAITQLKMYVFSASSSLPGDVYGLFMLAGGGYCLNMLFGAISFRLAYWTATKSTQILGVKG